MGTMGNIRAPQRSRRFTHQNSQTYRPKYGRPLHWRVPTCRGHCRPVARDCSRMQTVQFVDEPRHRPGRKERQSWQDESAPRRSHSRCCSASPCGTSGTSRGPRPFPRIRSTRTRSRRWVARPSRAGRTRFDTSMNNAAPSLSGPGITTPIAGVFFSPSGGSVARDEIAVFTFDVLTIGAGVTVQGAQNATRARWPCSRSPRPPLVGTLNVSGGGGEQRARRGRWATPGRGGGGGGGGGDSFGTIQGGGGVGFVNGALGMSSGSMRRRRRQRGAARRRVRERRRLRRQRREFRGRL